MSLSNITEAVEKAVIEHMKENPDDCYICSECKGDLREDGNEVDEYDATYKEISIEPCQTCLNQKDEEIDELEQDIEGLNEKIKDLEKMISEK